MPVNPNSTAQSEARARLTDLAAGYQLLTGAQREGWIALGEMMTRTDSLGQTYNLTGLQAYISVNTLLLLAGEAEIVAAPAHVIPAALDTITPTITAATMSLAFTATPTGADEFVFAFASPQRSAGRAFESDFRLISVAGDAAASPVNMFAAYVARLGTPVVGRRVFFSVQRMKNGFLSAPLVESAVVA